MTLTHPTTTTTTTTATHTSTIISNDTASQHLSLGPRATTTTSSSSLSSHEPVASITPTPLPPSTTTETALKADFSITLQSESTTKLNATFQRLMDTIHAIPGLAIRGPIRLPKDGKIHSRRVDIKSIPERLLRDIGSQSGILLAEDAGEERIQENGVVVSFDIE
ncbi:MAG: hypothetical protein J3R72DRAFT_446514 [Linnemannia gamsii]|nr:MAG: hypothetical protein J3R72DRAFT_446514 [Linnemannia gamsii]